MNALFSYIDFLVRTFDVRSKTSRRCYWVVFFVNTALSVLLTTIGIVIPQGMPLAVYIAISSMIATPLFIPFFTAIARRLNDADIPLKRMWLLLLPGVGLIPLLVFCAFPSKYATQEDFSAYRDGVWLAAIRRVFSSAMAVFPFFYLVCCVYKLVTATDTFGIGLNAAMLSINFVICVFTVAEAKLHRFGKFLGVWKILKSLTAISSALLSVIFYHDAQNFVDAVITVYLYFYVTIGPFVLAGNLVSLLRKKKQAQ